jgi:hypothetical protein
VDELEAYKAEANTIRAQVPAADTRASQQINKFRAVALRDDPSHQTRVSFCAWMSTRHPFHGWNPHTFTALYFLC